MAELRRDVGVLSALGHAEVRKLLWPEGTIALILGIGGGTALLYCTSVSNRVTLVTDTLQALGILLGVVFTAFALFFSLLSDDYMRLLDKASGGVLAFMRPFMIAVGCQTTTLILALAYIAVAPVVDGRVEVGLFLTWALLFTFSVADVVALARSIAMHAVTRAQQVRTKDGGPEVRRIGRNH